MNTFGWCMIGSGNIAKKVLREITNYGKHKLVSIYSRNGTEATTLAERYHGKAYDTLSGAVLDEKVQGVYIGTPHSVHYSQIIQCLSLGKHVFCEKPLVVNHDQFDIVAKVAKEKALFLGEAMWMRYNTIIIRTMDIIKSGKIGKIQEIKADIGFDATKLKTRKRLFSPEYAGGALLDVGVYLLTFVHGFLGFTDQITVQAEFGEEGVDLVDKIVLHYGKTICRLECSVTQITPATAVISCEKGSITIPMFFKPIEASIVIGGETEIIKGERGYRHEFDYAAELIKRGDLDSGRYPLESVGDIIKMMDLIRGKIELTYPTIVEQT